jgi:hypothetical protein
MLADVSAVLGSLTLCLARSIDRISIQIVTAVMLPGAAAFVDGTGHAQQTSDVAGPISKVVADG